MFGASAFGVTTFGQSAADTLVPSTVNLSYPENFFLYEAIGSDAGGYSITGGADSDQFSLDNQFGDYYLIFTGDGTRNFEAPADSNLDNVYTVQVSGGGMLRTFNITTTDVVETVNRRLAARSSFFLF